MSENFWLVLYSEDGTPERVIYGPVLPGHRESVYAAVKAALGVKATQLHWVVVRGQEPPTLEQCRDYVFAF